MLVFIRLKQLNVEFEIDHQLCQSHNYSAIRIIRGHGMSLLNIVLEKQDSGDSSNVSHAPDGPCTNA